MMMVVVVMMVMMMVVVIGARMGRGGERGQRDSEAEGDDRNQFLHERVSMQ
jgi:uncharacterized membrane protein